MDLQQPISIPETFLRSFNIKDCIINLFCFRLIEHRQYASSCRSLIPLAVELRPSFNSVEDHYSYVAAFFLPTELVTLTNNTY